MNEGEEVEGEEVEGEEAEEGEIEEGEADEEMEDEPPAADQFDLAKLFTGPIGFKVVSLIQHSEYSGWLLRLFPISAFTFEWINAN